MDNNLVLEGSATTMSQDHFLDLLPFGLTLLQAKVYVTLLGLGASRASTVATSIGVVRPEAYRILRELCEKGLVQKTLESPVVYAAISPNKALSLLLQKNKAQLAALNEKKAAVVESLSSLTLQEKEQPDHGLRVITGGMNLVLKVIQMATEAKEDYVQILSKYGLRTLEEDGILRAISSVRKRGIPIRVITETDSSNRKMADRLSRTVNVRTTRNLLFYMAIIDRKEMVFGPAFPANEEERSSLDRRELDVWTDNSRFVEGMYSLFQKLWEICPKQPLINKASH